MRLDNIVVVAKREYLQRVRSKGFWIGTLLLPIFIAAVTILPALLIFASRTSQTIVVVDETGRLAQDFAQRATSRSKKPEPPKNLAKDLTKQRGLVVDESQMANFEVTVEPLAAKLLVPERRKKPRE